jgi:hypothetical protein
MQAQDRDPQLWRLAQARARFKSHLLTYLLVNALLWGIWLVGGHHFYGGGLPWPIWSTVFWGFGVASQGLRVYGFGGEVGWSEREYQQLLREREAGHR